ncbi:hypothetical protein U3516DRAFT_733615 [Neocallimastix sp. 'constans']
MIIKIIESVDAVLVWQRDGLDGIITRFKDNIITVDNVYSTIKYELNINSLDISCDLVYEELYEYKSELQSSGGHDDIYTCEKSCDITLTYNTIHFVAYKCTKDSDLIRHPYNIITSCLIIQYIRCDKALYIQYENDKESSTKSCRKKFMYNISINKGFEIEQFGKEFDGNQITVNIFT